MCYINLVHQLNNDHVIITLFQCLAGFLLIWVFYPLKNKQTSVRPKIKMKFFYESAKCIHEYYIHEWFYEYNLSSAVLLYLIVFTDICVQDKQSFGYLVSRNSKIVCFKWLLTLWSWWVTPRTKVSTLAVIIWQWKGDCTVVTFPNVSIKPTPEFSHSCIQVCETTIDTYWTWPSKI